jgi:hypothetical protein
VLGGVTAYVLDPALAQRWWDSLKP